MKSFKKKKWCFFLILLTFSVKVYAQSGVPLPQINSETHHKVPMSIEYIGEHAQYIKKSMGDSISSLISIVEHAQPEGDHLFAWSNDKAHPHIKSVHIVLTSSVDPIFSSLYKRSGSASILDKENTITADALSIVMKDEKTETYQTSVVLLVDKIYWDDLGNERMDGNARFIIALGHELYGNITSYLEMTEDEILSPSQKNRIDMEYHAFTESVAFVKRASEFLKDIIPSISKKIKNLLPTEEKGLAFWRQQKQLYEKAEQNITFLGNEIRSLGSFDLDKITNLSIYNVQGTLIETKKISHKKPDLNLNYLEPGLYFISFEIQGLVTSILKKTFIQE